MKTAVQPVSKEYSDLDDAAAVNPRLNDPINLCDDTGEPISVATGEPIQWWWEYNFSVTITGVFGSISIAATEQSPNSYLTPALMVTGPAGTAAYCKYIRLDPGDNPQPAPPPNVIIVDNSGGDKGAPRKGSINVVRGH